MQTNQIIGLVLILVGISDPLIGIFLVAPRAPEERRKLIVGAMIGGGITLIALGFLFLAGVLG
jgi:hypothetical protein